MARNFVTEMNELQVELAQHRRDGTDWRDCETRVDALEREIEQALRKTVQALGLDRQ